MVRKRDNITIGQSAKNMFVVPSDALPRDWLNYGALIDGFKSKYGLTVNELYGQTECNFVLASSAGDQSRKRSHLLKVSPIATVL